MGISLLQSPARGTGIWQDWRSRRQQRRERLQVFVAQMTGNEAQVNLGGVEVCVTKERLDHAQVRAPTQQMDRDAVAQEVWVDAEADYAGEPAQEDARHLAVDALAGVQQSMSKTGCCYDNAVAESFFHSLKVEWVHDYDLRDRETTRIEIFRYIESSYNRSRRHSSLGYLSPAEFERRKQEAA
jgi:transposase InsO family protein